jgi:hypothetical protein
MTETPAGQFPEISKSLSETSTTEGVYSTVLWLRVSPTLWTKVSRRQPSFDRTLEAFLRGVECYMIEEPELVVDKEARVAAGSVRHVIAAEGFELRLRQPDGWWDWDIVELLPRVERDVSGRWIDDQITVSAPEAVYYGEVAVLIKTRRYRQLPDYDQVPVNLAWNRLRKGRSVQRIFWKDDVIFYLTCKREETSSVEAVGDINDALQKVSVGQAITDPYELRRIREMAVKFGETLHT